MANSRAEEIENLPLPGCAVNFNRVHEQFDESECEASYLITHFNRVICFLSRASSFFFLPTELESLTLRARQITVAVKLVLI